ncbi:MAG: hypothetical protein LUD47_07970 [Clostridia bacterium]|nr:hypothetical protein [Clostridia bacterium]
MADDFYDKLNTEAAKLETNEAYENFVDKFKPKLTTDDCFTPPEIYEVVKTWAIEEYSWQDREIVRPFYPNGDYINETYPENCVVIDNPPFSIISEIARFYEVQHIDYFLFAPGKTLMGIKAARSHIVTDARVTYDNGAEVSTSFICSQGEMARTAPDLNRAIETANDDLRKLKYKQPPHCINTRPKLCMRLRCNSGAG